MLIRHSIFLPQKPFEKADTLQVRNLVGCAEPIKTTSSLHVILILSLFASQSHADRVAERDGTVDGQQSYTGAIVSDVIAEQLHTLEKVVCLLCILLGLDGTYVLQSVLLLSNNFAQTHRIFPELAHLAILLPSPSYAAVAQFGITQLMDEVPRTLSPESSAVDTGKWIGRVVIAVILAEGIWGFIVSVTNNLVLPVLARTMGAGDIQSPLYLGKGDFNVPALFTAVLELCFAGIAAVILNSWLQRKPKVTRTRAVRVSPIPMQSIAPTQPMAPPPSPPAVVPVQASVPVPSSAPMAANVLVPTPATPAAVPAQTTASPTAPSPGQFWSPPEPPPQPKVAAPPPPPKAKPSKPKPPKEVYYNIVGEPINPTEDD